MWQKPQLAWLALKAGLTVLVSDTDVVVRGPVFHASNPRHAMFRDANLTVFCENEMPNTGFLLLRQSGAAVALVAAWLPRLATNTGGSFEIVFYLFN